MRTHGDICSTVMELTFLSPVFMDSFFSKFVAVDSHHPFGQDITFLSMIYVTRSCSRLPHLQTASWISTVLIN